jgi:hypothetical protein
LAVAEANIRMWNTIHTRIGTLLGGRQVSPARIMPQTEVGAPAVFFESR